MTLYLDPLDYERWSACPGSPALAENDPPTPHAGHPAADVSERVAWFKEQSAAIQVILNDPLDISSITGEKRAVAHADAVIIADFGTHSILEVWHTNIALKGVPIYVDTSPELKILTLAALAKYSLLHEFTDTKAGSIAELAAFGEEVKAKAALCLELRANVAALSQLVVGDHCNGCPAAYRCPQLHQETHEEVFGEVQPLEEANPTILEPRTRVSDPKDLPAYLERCHRKLPLIEHWVRQVKAHHALLTGKSPKLPKVKRRRRKSGKSTRRAPKKEPTPPVPPETAS